MKKSLLLLSCLFVLSAQAQKLTGTWSGILDVGATKLHCVFNLSTDASGADVCTFDSPDQGAKGIPAKVDFLSADSIHATVSSIYASYEGRLKDGVLKGIFAQGGYKIPLDLTPGKPVLAKRPQTPKPPFDYASEEVYFTNTIDKAKLCGTLTYPVGYDKMDRKSVPVVLMVTGSGLQDRDETLFNHKPFAVIADYLAKHGIASLRFDDRGMGKSTGDVKHATTLNFMRDAAAGLDYLRQTHKFGKVGALGHSEGGTIMFMLGSRKKADFIISLAGTGIRGDSILISQQRKIMALGGSPLATNDKFFAYMKQGYQRIINGQQPVAHDAAAIAAIAKECSLPEEVIQQTDKSMLSLNDWFKYFIKYDPAVDIKATHCPVMAINGSSDAQVIAEYNLPAIKRLLPAGKKNLIKEYPGLNHPFQHCKTGMPTEYNEIEETISPEVLQDIATWIKSL